MFSNKRSLLDKDGLTMHSASMERSFWSARWEGGRIGFHLEDVNPNLEQHWPGLTNGDVGRVLVPLCGKSNDLQWLAERGHLVEGVEFIPEAVESFFSERGLSPERGTVGSLPSFAKDGLRLIVGDFFQLSSDALPSCAWVYDRAALVAISPDRRREYLEQVHRLTQPGAGLMLVNFVHDIGSGPPFSIPSEELLRLADSLFELELQAERDILDERFASRGATSLVEQVWYGRRR